MTINFGSHNKNYKRIARNAAMLYIRMLLTMVVTLYTSRVVLEALGVSDFGIYHVVAGFVTMLGFLNSAMASATQRFLAFEIGKSGGKGIDNIFSMCMNIHIIIALVVLLIGEILGLWFLESKMTIPVDRINAAKWVFHLALISFTISIVSVPYNALIIAHERMDVFAWVSIIDVTLKLLIVFMLEMFGIDKLILYALLSLAVVFIVFAIYRAYCIRRFNEAIFKLYWDQNLFKVMLSYTGWNLWGNMASVMSGQGVNVLLNIFFGPAVNAARTVAMQASGALNSFVQNLQIAVNPQIIKSYAKQDMDYMHRLVCYGAKYNFYLLLFLAFPVLIHTDTVLALWLVNVPKYAAIFLQLIIVNILIDSISAPLMTSAQATGKIRLYQSVVGGILLLNVPLSYVILKFGHEPQAVILIGITVSVFAFTARLFILKKLINLPVAKYLTEVVGRGILVVTTIGALNYLMPFIFLKSLGIWLSAISISICVLCSIVLVGISQAERNLIYKKFKQYTAYLFKRKV